MTIFALLRALLYWKLNEGCYFIRPYSITEASVGKVEVTGSWEKKMTSSQVP